MIWGHRQSRSYDHDVQMQVDGGENVIIPERFCWFVEVDEGIWVLYDQDGRCSRGMSRKHASPLML